MRTRILGIAGKLLMVAALAAGAAEVYGALERGAYHVVSLGELWLELSPKSLGLLASHLPPLLWTGVFDPLLRLPLWLLLGAPGVLLEYLHDAQRAHRDQSAV